MAEAYIITSPSGKSYVGVTSMTAVERWLVHFKDARAGKYPRNPLTRAIRKYGPDAFVVRTLIQGTWEYVLELENKLIQAYGTMRPGGYNAKQGGTGGRMAPETCEQMSRSRVQLMKNPAQRERMRREQLEIWQRPGYREKMRAVHKARERDPKTEAKRKAYRKAQSIRMTRWWAERRAGGFSTFQ